MHGGRCKVADVLTCLQTVLCGNGEEGGCENECDKCFFHNKYLEAAKIVKNVVVTFLIV